MNLHDQHMRRELYKAQRGRCKAPCGPDFRGVCLELRLLELDHIDSNGPDGIENRQLLCSHCNRVKGNRPMDALIDHHRARWERKQLPIFNGGRIYRRQRPTVDKKPKPRPLYRNLPVVPVVLELF